MISLQLQSSAAKLHCFTSQKHTQRPRWHAGAESFGLGTTGISHGEFLGYDFGETGKIDTIITIMVIISNNNDNNKL